MCGLKSEVSWDYVYEDEVHLVHVEADIVTGGDPAVDTDREVGGFLWE